VKKDGLQNKAKDIVASCKGAPHSTRREGKQLEEREMLKEVNHPSHNGEIHFLERLRRETKTKKAAHLVRCMER